MCIPMLLCIVDRGTAVRDDVQSHLTSFPDIRQDTWSMAPGKWYQNITPIIGNILKAKIANTDPHTPLDLQEWVQSTIFTLLCACFLGEETPERVQTLRTHFDGQIPHLHRMTKVPMSAWTDPRFLYHRRHWRKILRIYCKQIGLPAHCLLQQTTTLSLDELSDMFFGSVMSVGSAVLTAMVYFDRHPDQQATARQEPSMGAAAAFVEALRLHTPAPILTCIHTDNPDAFDINRFWNIYAYTDDYNDFQAGFIPFRVPVLLAVHFGNLCLETLLTEAHWQCEDPWAYEPQVNTGTIRNPNPVRGRLKKTSTSLLPPTPVALQLDAFHRTLIALTDLGPKPDKTFADVHPYHDIFDGTERVVSVLGLPHVQRRAGFRNGLMKVLRRLPFSEQHRPWFSVQDFYRTTQHYLGTRFQDHEGLRLPLEHAQCLAQLKPDYRLFYFVTAGLGAHLLEDSHAEGTHCVDLRSMAKYEVRPGYVRYGACLEIDLKTYRVMGIRLPGTPQFQQGQLTGFIDQREAFYEPDHPQFQFAYNVFVASLLTYVTLGCHAYYTHFAQAGGFLAFYYKHRDDVEFRLRSLLHIFLFNTLQVNANAQDVLVADNGIVYRIFALTHRGMQDFMRDYTVRQMDVLASDLRHQDTPFARDFRQFYAVAETFSQKVADFLFQSNETFVKKAREAWPSVAPQETNLQKFMVKWLSNHMTAISFFHESVGTVGHWLLSPELMKSKVSVFYPMAEMESQNSSIQNLFLVLQTSVERHPRLTAGLGRYLVKELKDAFNELEKDLEALHFECVHLDDQYLEVSVSL